MASYVCRSHFWEANPKRARSFAKELQGMGKIHEPFVVGAALTLGNCIDTLNEDSIGAIKMAHDKLKNASDALSIPLAKNTSGADLLAKRLDCSVINMLHEMIADHGLEEADSLRGLYYEGDPIYPTASFYMKSHVQICIRNPECIKGVFRVS